MSRSREEQETILRWDQADQSVKIYTAAPGMAAKLSKRGYTMTPIRRTNGTVTGWEGTAPKGCLIFRTLRDGQIPKPAHPSTPPPRPTRGAEG